MFGSITGLSEFRGSGFRCEDLILLCFCLQMLHDKILKVNNENHTKQKNTSSKKRLQPIKSAFFEKWI